MIEPIAPTTRNDPTTESTSPAIITIGHSNYEISLFLERLIAIEARFLVDARSVPSSRYCPQFNRRSLEKSVPAAGLQYVLAGDFLGGKSAVSVHAPQFTAEIERVISISQSEGRVALMCAEREPRQCHRATKLSAYILRNHPGVGVAHLLHDGSVVDAAKYESSINPNDLWHELRREVGYGQLF